MARTTTVAIAFSVLLAQRVLALGDANGLSVRDAKAGRAPSNIIVACVPFLFVS